jgi:segregation and condensation protein B
MEELSLDNQIEAVLFWKGEPQTIKKLAASLGKKEEEILSALEVLKEKIKNRGVELVFNHDQVMLGTAANLSHIIERLTKEELVRDLGKAGLETISIIAYKGPISRAEIDYIRGVQSNFILRNLQIRGLIERITNPKDARSFLYRPTFELLQFLGVSKIEDLPEFEKVKAEFEQNLDENKAEVIDEVSKEDSPLPEEAPDEEPTEVENLEIPEENFNNNIE